MNWFKRGTNRQDASKLHLPDKVEYQFPDVQPRRDTDPQTCMEVFQNHWKQAWLVIGGQDGTLKERYTADDVETVIHNIEQMMTLLASEESYDSSPGPILQFVIKENTLEKFGHWCGKIPELQEKLICDQLKMFYQLIAHSEQLVLIHRSIFHPLTMLLSSCADHLKSKEVEELLAQVLHQICICISQQTSTLETFFSMEEEKGPAEYLVFSLILYIHRDGRVGQQAREALLLIMTLSNKYPHIGKYISDHSHLCPVLATGLSGLFSSLPRKINITNDEWHRLTVEDWADIPDLILFLNSLEFCNAVLQIAHPLVRDQLVKYIYNGFLVPVLGAALHQNSREEVITATAYLELFLRKITEPTLIKAFLRFILTEKYDEIVILDSLITRINSNSRLSLVSLSLFTTLVDLNCEDVMFQLVFKYLIPCTHVMISQKRAVKDVDFHSKSAEKFLSLRPKCCSQIANQDGYQKDNSENVPLYGSGLRPPANADTGVNFQRSISVNESSSSGIPGPFSGNIEDLETSYLEYLNDAHKNLRKCCNGCRNWSAPYDGEKPSSSSLNSLNFLTPKKTLSGNSNGTAVDKTICPETKLEQSEGTTKDNSLKLLSHGNSLSGSVRLASDKEHSEVNDSVDIIDHPLSQVSSSPPLDPVVGKTVGSAPLSTTENPENSYSLEALNTYTAINQLYSLLLTCDDMDSFLKFLDCVDIGVVENEKSDEIFTFIDNLFSGSTSLRFSHGIHSNAGQVKTAVSVGSKDLITSTCSESSIDISIDNPSPAPPVDEDATANINSEENDKKLSLEDEDGQQTLTSSMDISSTSTVLSQESADITMSQLNGIPFEMSACKTLTTLPQQTGQTSSEHNPLQTITNTSNSLHMFNFGKKSNALETTATPSPNGISASKYVSGPPNIGPLLSALLSKLESMIQNSLHVNFLLTGLISRLATYPHPLLRSFLLNHNLVFQPSIKSLVQVLSSVRHKVDHYSCAIPNFAQLVAKARQSMNLRICMYSNEQDGKVSLPRNTSSPGLLPKSKSAEYCYTSHKGAGRKHSFFQTSTTKPAAVGQLFSRMGPSNVDRSRPSTLERMPGGRGYRYINQQSPNEHFESNPMDNAKTRNAVYCAIVLEEFLKELAALSQEHSVLLWEQDYLCS